MHCFDLSLQVWTPQINCANTPSERLAHATSVVGSTIYLHGGRATDKTSLDDLWAFDTTTSSWNQIEQQGEKPMGRSYHGMTSWKNHLFIFGGCGASGGKDCMWDDLWKFDLSSKLWTKLQSGPSQRGGPVLTSASDKLYVVFGFNGKEMDDFWAYDIQAGTWEKLQEQGQVPEPRSVHGGCTVGESVWIFGGEGAPSTIGHDGAGTHFNNSFLLDTNTLLWKKIDFKSDVPSPRGWFAATAIPGGAAIFGGLSNQNERLDELYLCYIEDK